VEVLICFFIACCIFSAFILWGMFLTNLNNKNNKNMKEWKIGDKFYLKPNWNTLGNHFAYNNPSLEVEYTISLVGDYMFKNCKEGAVSTNDLYNGWIPIEVISKTKYNHPDLIKKEENLVGRWVKATRDYPNSGKVLSGEYGKITYDSGFSIYADFKSQASYSCTRDMIINGDGYELMPEGFIPLEETKSVNMEDILREAKLRYPIGTKFRSEFSDKGNIREVLPYDGISDECTWYKSGTEIRSKDGLKTSDINGKIVCSNPVIYDKGIWAEIISLPEEKPMEKSEFKKGDYIVLTEANFDLSSYSLNYCYKQCDNYIYFRTYLDDKGSTFNGYDACQFDNKGKIKWRYASKQEADEYERIGKPYNVSTLQSKKSNYTHNPLPNSDYYLLECVKDCYNFKAGDITWNVYKDYDNFRSWHPEVNKNAVNYPKENFKVIKEVVKSKYFSTNPIVQKLEDITRDWIPGVTMFKSANSGEEYKFNGIGTRVWNDGDIFDSSGTGLLYYQGKYATKVEEEVEAVSIQLTTTDSWSSRAIKAMQKDFLFYGTGGDAAKGSYPWYEPNSQPLKYYTGIDSYIVKDSSNSVLKSPKSILWTKKKTDKKSNQLIIIKNKTK
jgi:hypothetical protein